MWDPDAVDYGFRAGLSGGIGLTIPISGRMQIETGLIYDRKGGDVTVPENWNSGPRNTLEMRLDYLTLPAYARVSLASAYGPYLKVGSELGFLLSVHDQYRGYDSADFRDIDVSIVGAGGFLHPVASHAIFVELAYVHGLLDVIDPPGPLLFEAEAFNRELRLSFGFAL